MKKVEDYIRSIPDFPEKGIIFRDVTSILQDADGLQLAIDEMKKLLDGVDFDVNETKTIIAEEKEEYVIPLKITKPTKTVKDIGTEAFPDLLATFSTKYNRPET